MSKINKCFYVISIIPGIAIGLLAGMSVSPVIGIVISFIISSSVVTLGFQKNSLDLKKIIIILLCFVSVGIISGGILGAYIRVNNLLYNPIQTKEILQSIGIEDPDLIFSIILYERNGIIITNNVITPKGTDQRASSVFFSTTNHPIEQFEQLKPIEDLKETLTIWKAQSETSIWVSAAQLIEIQQIDNDLDDKKALSMLQFIWKTIRKTNEQL